MKRRKVSRKNKASPPPSAPEDLNATSPIYGLTAMREPESIEDPLEDWPESTGEADEWLTERGVPDEPEG
ncbi:MAG TPA: hypothetical protein VFI62_12155 [Burkholderiales bacterium]|nr:hypothetical protein [Burkholderiales bacterium]